MITVSTDRIKTQITPMKYVFGVQPMKPIQNAPEGQKRMKMRNRESAYLFVRNAEGIRKFLILDKGDHWEPGFEQARNVTVNDFYGL